MTSDAEQGERDRILLRRQLKAARGWGVPPTVFLRRRDGEDWNDEDTRLAMWLEAYEASLCPGGPHVLAETSRPERAGAYLPDHDPIVCHHCAGEGLIAKKVEQMDNARGVFFSLVLDEDRVALNLLPVPPLPEGFFKTAEGT